MTPASTTWTRCAKCGGLYLDDYITGGVCHHCARREREDKMTRLREELERMAAMPADDGDSDE